MQKQRTKDEGRSRGKDWWGSRTGRRSRKARDKSRCAESIPSERFLCDRVMWKSDCLSWCHSLDVRDAVSEAVVASTIWRSRCCESSRYTFAVSIINLKE